MYLNAHSYFSFHYGVMSPRALLQEASGRGVKTLALTDINHTGACQDFVRMAPGYGVKPVVGADFRNPARGKKLDSGVANRPCFVALAKSNKGFFEINDYLSGYVHAKKLFPGRAPEFEEVAIVYPVETYSGWKLGKNEYLGVSADAINKLAFGKWKLSQDKLVILHAVTFRNVRDRNAHKLLQAIGDNTLLSKVDPARFGKESDVMLSPDDFRSTYSSLREIVKNTEELLDQCNIEFDFDKSTNHKNQTTYTGSDDEDFRLIRQLCEKGLSYRYDKPSQAVLGRLEKELNMIRQKGFVAYFLINWRIISYALSKGYFYVGRGSGANSIVAYLLRITDVDPIELDLYFERFINLYRSSPPDFDIDFSWHDREDITRFIFNEFKNVSLLGTYSTLQQRAVLREIGKVFGLPAHEIERVQDGRVAADDLDGLSRTVRKYGNVLKGLPSHMSVHAGGILISEQSIHHYTGTFLPPKGFPTTQFDMITAEDIGLYKFDILGQRGLAKIRDCISIVRENRPEAPRIDIHDIPGFKEDSRIKDMLRNGQAIGCFYVESPAMRMLLRKLRVDNYLGLVAASSVIRPGVARSGMMREYILRYRFPERRKDAHPVLLDIMPETYGVMVYQEDVIKVAHYYAGLDLGEADVLRRGMSGKFRSRDEFAKIRDKFFSNSAGLGRDPEVTKEVWRQIESFAGYAFSKGHSASYAVESYQSLFLKAHYPIEYMVATINNGGGFYRRDLYLHEARLHGASVEGPCVNRSRSETIVKGKTIFIGLSMIKDLESESIARILGARAYRGNFSDLYEFIRRTALSLDQITTLVRIGALRFTGKDKKNMLWEAHFLLGHTRALQPVQELFDVEPRELKMPKLESLDYEDAFDQLELLGMTLCSPFDLLRAQEPEAITAIELDQFLGKTITALGYMVAVKYTRTIKGEPMYFGTFLDTNGMFLDTVHFPDSARRYPFRGRGVYRLEGLVVEEFGFFSIEVTRMEKEPYIDDPRFRDIPLREGEKARQNRDKQHDDRENNHTGENVKSGTPAEIDRGSG